MDERLESQAALDALLDRRVFQLDKKRWDAFNAALAAPPKDNPHLRKLLARKPVWITLDEASRIVG
ncbi:MAG: DUF1778 domain-containing protein [Xanthobacteraceae bacterium]